MSTSSDRICPHCRLWKFLQLLPDHNAPREIRLLSSVFNGHGQILHQVGKFLKIAGFFHLFLQTDLLHQLFDDLVKPTIVLFKHHNSFLGIIRRQDYSHTMPSRIQVTLSEALHVFDFRKVAIFSRPSVCRDENWPLFYITRELRKVYVKNMSC
jgi:hypothetical protein